MELICHLLEPGPIAAGIAGGGCSKEPRYHPKVLTCMFQKPLPYFDAHEPWGLWVIWYVLRTVNWKALYHNLSPSMYITSSKCLHARQKWESNRRFSGWPGTCLNILHKAETTKSNHLVELCVRQRDILSDGIIQKHPAPWLCQRAFMPSMSQGHLWTGDPEL